MQRCMLIAEFSTKHCISILACLLISHSEAGELVETAGVLTSWLLHYIDVAAFLYCVLNWSIIVLLLLLLFYMNFHFLIYQEM